MTSSTPEIEESGKKARIEIVPLIDVIFFLLATFVLFTLSLDKIASLPVIFPKSVDKPGPPNENLLSIQVSEHGTCYWKIGTGTPELISTNEIAPRLGEYQASHAHDARVLVRGDRRAKFGPAMTIFDEARRAGITEISIETVPSFTGK